MQVVPEDSGERQTKDTTNLKPGRFATQEGFATQTESLPVSPATHKKLVCHFRRELLQLPKFSSPPKTCYNTLVALKLT